LALELTQRPEFCVEYSSINNSASFSGNSPRSARLAGVVGKVASGSPQYLVLVCHQQNFSVSALDPFLGVDHGGFVQNGLAMSEKLMLPMVWVGAIKD
jgi:hypothetical protein